MQGVLLQTTNTIKLWRSGKQIKNYFRVMFISYVLKIVSCNPYCNILSLPQSFTPSDVECLEMSKYFHQWKHTLVN